MSWQWKRAAIALSMAAVSSAAAQHATADLQPIERTLAMQRYFADSDWRVWKFADGSVDVYFAPAAPDGLEANWIPTGEDFFLLFRLYGPDQPLFDRTWSLGDVEKVR